MAENMCGVTGVSHEALGKNRKRVFSGGDIGDLGSTALIENPNDNGVLIDGVRVAEECKVVVGESSSESVTSRMEMEGVELGMPRISNVSRNRVVEMSSLDDDWRSTKSVICMVERLLKGKFGLYDEEDANNFDTGKKENLIPSANTCHLEIEPPISVVGTAVDANAAGKDEYTVCQDLAPNQELQDVKVEKTEVTDSKDGVLVPRTRDKHDTFEKEGEYYVADLVWGKVRGHPWWPGLIFVPSAANDKAKKYFKRDSYLIAYFGDQSFAWNEASKIKPFRVYFSEMEKQSTSDKFSCAVDSALDEFARRIALGLSCQCLPSGLCEKKTQVIENDGIREDSSLLAGVDHLSTAAFFQPGELVQSLQSLAGSPLSNTNRLQFMKAKAQLSTFSKWRHNRQLPVLEESGPWLEDKYLFRVEKEGLNSDVAMEKLISYLGSGVPVTVSSRKRKSVSQCINSLKRRNRSEAEADPRMDEKYLSNLMSLNSPSLQNDGNSLTNSRRSRKTKSLSAMIPSLDVVFDNLAVAARSPIQGHLMIGKPIRRFLRKYRNSVCLGELRSRKRKGNHLDNMETTSTGWFQGTEDSDWTDRIIESSQDQLLFGLKTLDEHATKPQADAPGDPVSFGLDSLNEVAAKPQPDTAGMVVEVHKIDHGDANGSPEEHCQPIALTLQFRDADSVPAALILNEIFSCYGPLGEPVTKVASQTEIAKVIFRSRSDAETAYRSCVKFLAFGPSLISCTLSSVPQALDERATKPQTDAPGDPVSFGLEGLNEVAVVAAKPRPDTAGMVAEVDNIINQGVADGSPEEHRHPIVLTLHFRDADSIPSVPILNEIFSSYGPLDEPVTEVISQTKLAKVIFKNRAEAETAYRSCVKFLTLGPLLISCTLSSAPQTS